MMHLVCFLLFIHNINFSAFAGKSVLSTFYLVDNKGIVRKMFFDDFFDWLNSDAGEDATQAIDDIQMTLADASVDVDNRKIIWADGKRLSIDQSAARIQSISKVDIGILKEHIILWLEMDFVPDDLNQIEMSIFEEKIAQWIRDYKGHLQI